MTYCLAIRVDQGLVFASDSRTNAGVDQVSTYSKMHVFDEGPDRAVCILSSGNLATTQAVMRRLRLDNDSGAKTSINQAKDLAQVAEFVGKLSRAEQRKHASRSKTDKFNPEASFVVGGQVGKRPHQIYLVYPEGNYIAATVQTPYLQIGESKYGKPILDRIVNEDLSLEVAARCALVSMDSTMRSNVTVGPPIELLIYAAGNAGFNRRLEFREDNPYLSELRQAWHQGLKDAFERLPNLPVTRPAVQLVDARSES